MIEVKSGKIPVYCHMTELGACGGSGWTLVMKIDGTKVGIYCHRLYNLNEECA